MLGDVLIGCARLLLQERGLRRSRLASPGETPNSGCHPPFSSPGPMWDPCFGFRTLSLSTFVMLTEVGLRGSPAEATRTAPVGSESPCIYLKIASIILKAGVARLVPKAVLLAKRLTL